MTQEMVSRIGQSFQVRSRALASVLDLKTETLFNLWITALVGMGIVKVMTAPIAPRDVGEAAFMTLPYLLVALAPIAGYRIARSCFPVGLLSAQPGIRLSFYGRWRQLDLLSARQSAAFGPSGFMASLIVGILLNVPFRSVEFLLAVPAIGHDAPGWAQTILQVMTLDVIVMNFFYMVCFVMALRSVSLFPRMLLFVWIMDITMQLVIARSVGAAVGLPTTVGPALIKILQGNVQKVLISAVVWLPYLILSDRVNVTFRQRVRA
jgi:hypothetical protein